MATNIRNFMKPALERPVPSVRQQLGMRTHAAETIAAPSGCLDHPDRDEERLAVAASFRHFLPRWWFVNRDSGVVQRFNTLWPGQENVVEKMQTTPWLVLLKAGKLGFSELECAYDAWALLYRHQNMRVHIFSMDLNSAKSFLAIVKFGLQHLPEWLSYPIMRDEPGADTTRSLKLYAGPDDVRSVWSYPSTKEAAIDQVSGHAHLDELARMAWPQETLSAVQSTVAPGGSIHIVSRGQGAGNHLTKVYHEAMAGGSPFVAHFEPFTSRPRTPVHAVPEGADPNEVWYAEQQASGMTQEQLDWLAPRTAEDALRGSGEGAFIPEAVWLSCYDPDLPGLVPGDRTPLVIALDAGVTGDCFGAVAVSRHPQRHDDPAVRQVRLWKPPPGGEIDFDEVEDWLRLVCQGGCYNGHANMPGKVSAGQMCSLHPQSKYQHKISPTETCPAAGVACDACALPERVPKLNVVQVCYDAYQLVNMAQHLSRDRIAWMEAFSQGADRLEADANLRIMITQRRLTHRNDADLNEHIRNANAKSAAGEDSRLRLVKRAPDLKIDLAVATSMAVHKALYLNLRPASAA